MPLLLGAGCLVAIGRYYEDPEALVTLIVCSIFALVAAWVIFQSRQHYLDISAQWIEHRGFKNWKVRKADIIQVTNGRKSWVDDREFYLNVHAHGQEYQVDSGFLLNAKRVEEIAAAMRS